ncbi:MAG: RNA polymerase sigma factor [Phycisphaerales bacterium]|nr:RNA polymerase sigma factor [Phycisphaerales bacterium]
MVDPDAQLALKCKSGDNAATELLYRRYVDRVWRYGWFVTRSREAAGEIVQDTFLRVVRSIGRFEGRSTFATWLFALTRSAAMEFLRQKRQEERRRTDPAIIRLVTSDERNEADAEGEESREVVRQAVAELPGAQRDAVILCEFVGMSIAEVADVLGWGKSRVKVTLFRARRRLREMLRTHIAGELNGKCVEES